MEKISRLAAVTICVQCEVENETITSVQVHGDFFAGEGLSSLCSALVGCPYNRDSVFQVLKDRNSDNIIYGVSKEELLEAIF